MKIKKISYIELQEAVEASCVGSFMTSFTIYYEGIRLKCESAENHLVETLHIESHRCTVHFVKSLKLLTNKCTYITFT